MAARTGATAFLRQHGPKLLRDGLTDAEIREIAECSIVVVRRWRWANGLACNMPDYLFARDSLLRQREETMRLVAAGFDDAEAARMLGITVVCFRKRRWYARLRPGKLRRAPQARERRTKLKSVAGMT